MTSERKKPIPSLTFDTWKLRLRKDCQLKGQLPALDSVGDDILEHLWVSGLDPSIKAIMKYRSKHR